MELTNLTNSPEMLLRNMYEHNIVIGQWSNLQCQTEIGKWNTRSSINGGEGLS